MKVLRVLALMFAFCAASFAQYNVVAGFGADPTGATDSTTAIQNAISAACATTPPGGLIFFPHGTYKSTNTTTVPFALGCNNLHFYGEGFSVNSGPSIIRCPACTVPMFNEGLGEYGIIFEDLELQGNPNSAGSEAINLFTSGNFYIRRVFFDSFGGPAVVVSNGYGGYLVDNFAQNCMRQGASSDTGCFDIGNDDVVARGNFVSNSVADDPSFIGNGHAFAIAVRGTNGFWDGNMAELSQQGWLVTGAFNQFIENRSFLNQGNGFVVTGAANIFDGNKSLSNSQTANNTYSGFSITNGQGIYSNNIIDDTGSGDGNHTKNGFDDSNSNGSTDYIGNKYSNNKLGSGPAGVLYNMTGASPFAIQQPHRISADRGDTSITLQCAIDAESQIFNTALTITRSVNLSSTGAWNGCHFKIYRFSSGSPLLVGDLASTSLGAGQIVDEEYWNGSWLPTLTSW